VRPIALLLAALAAGPAIAQGSHAERLQQQCLVCHGPGGRSETALTPSLAGQPSFYAITQLFLFREGRRDSVAMTAVAKGMSDTDLRGFADAIGKLPPPAPPATHADPARMARGQALAQKGHCGGCHGVDYAGGQQVPRIAHQREDYLRLALQGFRAGTRLGYTNAMGEALAGYKPDDLDDLAHYLAHQPAR
jgi:cytochrome c553